MFRKGTEKDWQGVYTLICHLVRRELPLERFVQVYREQLRHDGYYCLVAENDENIYAVLTLRFDLQLHHCGACAEIIDFFVSEEYRSQGTGAAMLRIAEDLARERGCVLLEVTSNKARVHAHRFYMREDMNQTHLKFVKEFS